MLGVLNRTAEHADMGSLCSHNPACPAKLLCCSTAGDGRACVGAAAARGAAARARGWRTAPAGAVPCQPAMGGPRLPGAGCTASTM